MAYVSHRSFVHERLYGIDKGCASEWRAPPAPRTLRREPSFRTTRPSTDRLPLPNGAPVPPLCEPVALPATAAAPFVRHGAPTSLPLDLHIVEQPKGVIRAGAISGDKFSFRVAVRPAQSVPTSHVPDLGALFAVITLVGRSNYGVERPMPEGVLACARPGPPPEQTLATSVLLESHPAAMGGGREGHVQFEDLVIRQEGIFRIRVTVLQMGAGGGGKVLQSVESDLIVVEDM